MKGNQNMKNNHVSARSWFKSANGSIVYGNPGLPIKWQNTIRDTTNAFFCGAYIVCRGIKIESRHSTFQSANAALSILDRS